MRLITAIAACPLACAPAFAASADANEAVAANDSGRFLIASAGRFVLDDEVDDPYLIGLHFRGRPRTGWALRPGIGTDAGADDLLFVSAGGLDRPNYGAETLVLFLALPVRP